MAITEGGSIGPDFSTGYLESKERTVRTPILNVETGESEVLTLKTQEEIDSFFQNMMAQDGEWD